jgi:hypothetical protein
MLTLFVVYIAPGHSPDAILSEETQIETSAQTMTLDEAAAMGFSGITAPTDGREVRVIAVAQRDARWIQRALEANANVTSYKSQEVG